MRIFKWKELAHWAFFLLLCFVAGYWHGKTPEYQLQFLFFKKEPVKIIVFDRELLPENITNEIYDITHYPVEIEEVKNWNEMRLKTILNNGPHLLFLPSYWIPQLLKEGRLRNINPLRPALETHLSDEFNILMKEKIYEVPMLWTTTQFYANNTSKNWNRILTYKDQELQKIRTEHQSWTGLVRKNQMESQLSLLKFKMPENNEIIEVSNHLTQETKKLSQVKVLNKNSFYIFSLAVPNNTPNKNISFRILDVIISNDAIKNSFKEIPLGMTLKFQDLRSLKPQQSSDFVKNINLNDFELPTTGSW